MALTQSQIDAAKAVLNAALDAPNSTYNGQVVPTCQAFATALNAGLAQLKAVGLDTSQMVSLLNSAMAD